MRDPDRPSRLVRRFDELAARVLSAPARLGRTRLVAVDGPSGAGKTYFARRLATALTGLTALTARDAPVSVLNTDDLLDGWADQLSFWPRLEDQVLGPLRDGRPGRYRRYDWHAGRFGTAESVVPPGGVLLLEGVTTARAAAAAELSLAVFVTAPEDVRRSRVLGRDGSRVQPFMERWWRVERDFFRTDGTIDRADLVVDGAPVGVADSPDPGYVAFRSLPARRDPAVSWLYTADRCDDG